MMRDRKLAPYVGERSWVVGHHKGLEIRMKADPGRRPPFFAPGCPGAGRWNTEDQLIQRIKEFQKNGSALSAGTQAEIVARIP